MAQTLEKISEMTELTTLADGDYWPIVDISAAIADRNKHITYSSIKTNLDSVYSGIKNADETITVGSGKDFATIQEAIDSLAGYTIADCTITIAVDEGSYDEAVVLDCFICAGNGTVKLQGDTRANAGQTFTTTGNIVDNGDGTATITLASSPSSGWEDSGDSIIIENCTSSANEGEFPIVSRAGAAITYTNASVVAEAVLSYTTVTLKANRNITRTSAGQCILVDGVRGVEIDGIHCKTSTGADCSGVEVRNGGRAICSGVSVEAEDEGFFAFATGNYIETDDTCSAIGCAYGFRVGFNAKISCIGSVTTDCTRGFYAQYNGVLDASSAEAYGCTYGFVTEASGPIFAVGATAKGNITGYRASKNSYISAISTSANNADNSTNYSPAASDTEGNVYAIITWS